ncbi:uncharacterized protein LOC120664763 isoform X1 [Panicum virgatum]|uniref:F-box domain-containing protein n=1 Tax=Panicum virgatum TaxID=38727 RepID=A0A8T0VZG2_PANVG|nr:uncharacterized protein LOC120664763 isoform X1 [Panicum virgatum]KAG2640528.1 hypothetical protein PVAP13_2KG109832 [Panicum virgatum]
MSREISSPTRDPARPRCRVSRGDGVESTMRGIRENLRAALCIPGGNRRPPPTLPPPDDSAGEGREDLISALPDDVLLSVLLRLPSAARTSVLSRRWRRLWARLPELRFPHPTDPLALARSRAALAALAGPALRLLRVVAYDADPGDAAAVLRLAAARLAREVSIRNVVPECRKRAVVARAGARAAVVLPCFDRAELLLLCLGYLRLVMPLSGVFAKLTVLYLSDVRFEDACDLGDALSTARCPSLRKLVIHNAQGLSNLAICSESLSVDLRNLEGLQQLTVVAPMLRELIIINCFLMRQPVAGISAPVLEKLWWSDVYDPSSVQLGELAQLRMLVTCCFAGYGLFENMQNCVTVLLLQHFQKIAFLGMLIIPTNMVNYQYFMEATALLPDIENLHLRLARHGHVVGTCVFHMLKISTSIRRLNLDINEGIKEKAACSPGCVCHLPQDWETKELRFNSLEELSICGLSGADCDFTFVKRLLGWMPVLRTITMNFNPSAFVSEELCKELLCLPRPETCMKIYLYRNGAKVMYTPAC